MLHIAKELQIYGMEQIIERGSDLVLTSNFDVRCIEKELFERNADKTNINVVPSNYKELNYLSAQSLKSSKHFSKWSSRYESMNTQVLIKSFKILNETPNISFQTLSNGFRRSLLSKLSTIFSTMNLNAW